MFFTRLLFYLLGLLSARGQFPRYLRLVLGYYDCKLKLAAWHRAELEKLDPMFQLTNEVLRYADAQIEAEEKGIKPFEPGYPNTFSFVRPRNSQLHTNTIYDLARIARDKIK